MIAIDYFEEFKRIVREDAAKRLARIPRQPRPDFTSYISLTGQDGSDWEIEIGVCYSAIYEPAYISGLPEDCYPDSSEMDIHDIFAIDDLPAGITTAMVMDAAESQRDRLEEEAWEDYRDSAEPNV